MGLDRGPSEQRLRLTRSHIRISTNGPKIGQYQYTVACSSRLNCYVPVSIYLASPVLYMAPHYLLSRSFVLTLGTQIVLWTQIIQLKP